MLSETNNQTITMGETHYDNSIGNPADQTSRLDVSSDNMMGLTNGLTIQANTETNYDAFETMV
jgi:hypothetical protein